MEKHYKQFVNYESQSGEWDWFWPEDEEGNKDEFITLVRFVDSPLSRYEITMTPEEFDDLSNLIFKLNGR